MKSKFFITFLFSASFLHSQEIFLSPGEMKIFTLNHSAPAKKVYLSLTGRYQASGEGEWLQYHIFLRFNGTVLTEKHLVGPNQIIYPRYGVLTARGPRPRYNSQARCFAFKLDNDFSVNNPPFLWDNPVSATTENYSPTLVLDVTSLVRIGSNQLIVYNSNSFQEPRLGITGVFVMKEPVLMTSVPVMAKESPDYAPCWYYYQYYPESLPFYRKRLKKPVDSILKAEIAASLGTYYLFHNRTRIAKKYFLSSLSYSPEAPASDEVRFRLLRMALKNKQSQEAKSIVEEIKLPASPFAELAVAYYGAFTQKEELPRPLAAACRMETSICVDGILNEPVWQKTVTYPIDQMVPPTGEKDSSSSFRVFYNQSGLYFGFEGKRPPRERRPAPRQPKILSPVWETNCFELFIDPGCQADYYYELNIDDSGGIYHGKNRYLIGALPEFNPSWKAACFSTEESFSAEYFIPWRDFGLSREPVNGEIWGFNVIRVVVTTGEKGKQEADYSWSRLKSRNFHRIMDQGLLIFR